MDLSSTPPAKIMEAIRRGDLREKRALIESITHQPSDRAIHLLKLRERPSLAQRQCGVSRKGLDSLP